MSGTANGAPPADARGAALYYRDRGFAPLPLPARSKRPALDGWPHFRLTDDRLDEHFPVGRETNVGLLLGAPSGGLVDVDLDCPGAVAAAPLLLPPTGMATGRTSAPASHWWYVVDEPPGKASDKYADPAAGADDGLLVELRSTGGQTVVPPSVYPADPVKGRPGPEPCAWHRHGDPTRVSAAELRAAIGAVAAAALLGRHWPKARRNACALAISGGLLRAGWAEERVEQFLRAVVAANGNDPEQGNRVGTVAHTAAALGRDENVTGWPTLAQLLGEHGEAVVGRVRDWLGVVTPSGPRAASGSGGRPSASGSRPGPIPPYRPFPTRLLPPAVRDYVEATAAAMNCDPAYSALPALAALGAAIGSSHVASPKKGWRESPYVWALAIGRSGAVKSPPYRDVEDMAEDINDRLEREYDAAVMSFEARTEEWAAKGKDGGARGPRPQPPAKRAFVKGDVTIEALVGTLQDNPRGLLIGQDELSAWVNGFVKYAGKTGASDLHRWLQLYNAGTVNYTRKTGDRREVRIRGVGVSVTGTIQPKILARVLTEEFRASGFLARLLLAMPPWTGRHWTEAEVDNATWAGFADLLGDLHQLPADAWPDGRPRPHLVRLTDEAKALFVAFYDANGDALATADEDLGAAMSKLEGYALRFALIFHCCRLKEYAKDARIRPEDMRAAIELAGWFRDEAERVYAVLGETPEQQTTRQLSEQVARLADRHGGRLTTKQLQRSNQRKYPTTEAAEAALESLVTAGFGHWEPVPAGPRGGRPTRAFVPHGACDETDETPGDGPPEDDAGDDDSGPRVTKPPPCDESPQPGAGRKPFSDREFAGRSERAGEVSSVSSHAPCGGEPPDGPPAEPLGGFGHTQMVSSHIAPKLVTSADGLPNVVSAVKCDGGMVGLDVETTGLDHRADRVRLLQLAIGPEVFLIDLFALPDPAADLAPLFEALAAVEVVGHHLLFDLRFLARLGFTPGRVFCTQLASRVLHAGEWGPDGPLRHSLQAVARRHLGREVDKTAQASDWSAPALTEAQLAYAAEDAAVLPPLAEALTAKLAGAGLAETATREMKALPGIAWAAPIAVDADRWLALAADAEAQADRLAAELDALAPDRTCLPGAEARNWNSHDQVRAAFAAAGIDLSDTRDATLAAVDHPLAALLRDHRAARKRAGSYGRAWLAAYAPGGSVLPTWHPLGAESGRMACSDPALQQIPRGGEYRRCFVARPGHVLVKADYSQVELRAAAAIAPEPEMQRAYRAGEDLHALTAARLLGKPPAEVSKGDRQLAKAVNFGLLFGMGWRGLKGYARANYGVELTDDEARGYRDAFFRAYPGLRRWHDRVEADLQRLARADEGARYHARTVGGRRVSLAAARRGGDGTVYPNKSEALNAPVQGTAADGLKAAIGLLWERWGECPGVHPVLFVHDEVVVEAPAEAAETAADWLRRAMVDGMAPLIAPVPVEVDVTVDRTWGG